MSLKDQLAAKTADLKRATVTLPRSGAVVVVRELLFGDLDRTGYTKQENKSRTMIALVTEDPATGQPIWNHSDYNDLEAISQLYSEDAKAILEAMNRLSGIAEEEDTPLGNGASRVTASSRSRLPESLGALSPNSGK